MSSADDCACDASEALEPLRLTDLQPSTFRHAGQWPKLFSLAERPLVVSVWYRKYGVGEEELVEGEGVGML